MWRLCSKIYFIGNSFWKFYEVRSKRADFNSYGKWSSRELTLMLLEFWRGFLTFIQIDHGHTVILKPFDQKALNWLNFHQKSGGKFYFCLTLTWNSTIWVFHNAYSLAWALRTYIGWDIQRPEWPMTELIGFKVHTKVRFLFLKV